MRLNGLSLVALVSLVCAGVGSGCVVFAPVPAETLSLCLKFSDEGGREFFLSEDGARSFSGALGEVDARFTTTNGDCRADAELQFETADGERFQVGVEVEDNAPFALGDSLLPGVAADVTLTRTLFIPGVQHGVAVYQEGNLRFAVAEAGRAILDTKDAFPFSIKSGEPYGAIYREECGDFQRRSITFAAKGSDVVVAIEVGESALVDVGSLQYDVHVVESYAPVGELNCLDDVETRMVWTAVIVP